MLGLLALKCDGNHTHKSWKPTIIDGVVSFPTKEEAAYPITLCERLAPIFLYWARVRDLEGPRDLMEQTKADTDAGKRQLFTGQPRTKTILQPVSEFGHFVAVAIPLNCDNLHTIIASLPKGAKATSRTVQRVFSRDVFKANHHGKVLVHQELKHGQDYEVVMVGVPRTPTEFIEAARLVGHPCGHLVRTTVGCGSSNKGKP